MTRALLDFMWLILYNISVIFSLIEPLMVLSTVVFLFDRIAYDFIYCYFWGPGEECTLLVLNSSYLMFRDDLSAVILSAVSRDTQPLLVCFINRGGLFVSFQVWILNQKNILNRQPRRWYSMRCMLLTDEALPHIDSVFSSYPYTFSNSAMLPTGAEYRMTDVSGIRRYAHKPSELLARTIPYRHKSRNHAVCATPKRLSDIIIIRRFVYIHVNTAVVREPRRAIGY